MPYRCAEYSPLHIALLNVYTRFPSCRKDITLLSQSPTNADIYTLSTKRDSAMDPPSPYAIGKKRNSLLYHDAAH